MIKEMGVVFVLTFALLAGCLGNESQKIDDGGIVIEETLVNSAPVILIMDQSFAAEEGTNLMISGMVTDEEVSTVTIHLRLISEDTLKVTQGPFTIYPDAEGQWSQSIIVNEPGIWFAEVWAEDLGGKVSPEYYADIILEYPIENIVTVSLSYTSPTEDSNIGYISGQINHLFLDTCTIAYNPSGQMKIEGIVDIAGTSYSIQINEDSTSKQGDIEAICGKWDIKSKIISYSIPMQEDEEDSDADGFVDNDDECPDTPNGEPVYSNGCSDSQIDSDGDGVNDSEDICPGFDDNIDADQDGIADGCDDLVDSDGDGVADSEDICAGFDDSVDSDQDEIPNGCDDDDDNDGVDDDFDLCPGTATAIEVDTTGCPIVTWEPQDSWVCTDGQGPWVKDYNGDGNGYTANTNGVSSPNGGGSGPWFQCKVSVSIQNEKMVVESNGIPNHDFLSTMGCCAPEMDYTSYITLNPVNDTNGGHDTTNCPASAGRWECVPDRGTVAMGVNGAPIYGPEEGPGGDAVALHFSYFEEDRQPIFLGWCTGHSAGSNGYHYHYDANCIYWEPENGEDMSDYDLSKIRNDQHSPIIGWAFDGFPIYGMYGYDDDGQTIRAITSSYAIERTQDGGDQGYNGIDDWNYANGVGDLDECNGRFGPTPEYPGGIYHYVSTPLSGSPNAVTDTNGQTVGMIGFPYFLLCYHGIADVAGQDVGGGQGGGGGGGGPPPSVLYSTSPIGFELVEEGTEYFSDEMIVYSAYGSLIIMIVAFVLFRKTFRSNSI